MASPSVRVVLCGHFILVELCALKSNLNYMEMTLERERERERARRSREIIGVDRGAEGEEIWHSSKPNFFCVALSRQNLGLWINS